jgi:prophage DNA circulation protein
MVDFRTELRDASFRGISFLWVDDDGLDGRRVATHEYPGRDEPSHEDLGAATEAFSFRATVIGNGFVALADALHAAFRQKGAGTLVHPHFGEMQVVVKECRRVHSITAIGEVQFNVSVERAGANGGLTVLDDTARQLTLASTSMAEIAQGDFLSNLAQGLFPSYVTEDGIARMTGFVQLAHNILRNHSLPGFGSFLGFIGLDSSAADQVMALFQGVASNTRGQVQPVVGSSTTAAPVSAVATIEAMVDVAASHVDAAVTADSPSRAAIVTNASAITTFVQSNALAAAGGAARYAEYDSREQAINIREKLAGGLSNLRDRQLTAGNMNGFRATTDMLVAVTKDISEQLGRLPKTVMVRGANVRPSLAIANRLYGDDASVIFDRAGDIARRNGIAHPGFVGTQALEVLVNG